MRTLPVSGSAITAAPRQEFERNTKLVRIPGPREIFVCVLEYFRQPRNCRHIWNSVPGMTNFISVALLKHLKLQKRAHKNGIW
mgnify:CR=1 FL=1